MSGLLNKENEIEKLKNEYRRFTANNQNQDEAPKPVEAEKSEPELCEY